MSQPHQPTIVTSLVTIAVFGYTVILLCLWLGVSYLADRVVPITLIAFGPRWPAGLPLLPLAFIAPIALPRHVGRRLLAVLVLASFVLVLGFLDFRLGLARTAGTPVLRVMTYNLGESRVTVWALDQLMKAERVDIAAIQECPFYDYDMARLGWHFYYSGDMCLVSRYPFTVLDVPDPKRVWRNAGREPARVEIETPAGPIQFVNVHLQTIRNGVDALRAQGWRGLVDFSHNRERAALESRVARERLRRDGKPFIVAGDFNLPVESAVYRRDWGDLLNGFSACGRGFGHTKFTRLFGIRIDHVLVSQHWRCVDARVVHTRYGGDHAPLIVDLVSQD